MNSLNRMKRVIGVVLPLATVTAGLAEQESGLAWSVATRWESKYVSVGRDNLGKVGLASFVGTVERNGVEAGIWYGIAERGSYDELNLSLGYGFDAGPLAVSLGYTRLEFVEDGGSDNEWSAAVALNGLPLVVPCAAYTYSTEAEGGFVELGVQAEFELLDGRLTLVPSVVQGLDYGYASRDHDGRNHVQVGLDAELALTDSVSLLASVAHSWAQRDARNDDAGDVAWASAGLSVAF